MNKDNTQLAWEQIPEEIKTLARIWLQDFWDEHYQDWMEAMGLEYAKLILQAIKPIVEKAYEDGVKAGASNATRQYGDYWETSKGETYWNSLITKGI